MAVSMSAKRQVQYLIQELKERERLPMLKHSPDELRSWVKQHSILERIETVIAPEILGQRLLKELSTLALFGVRKPFYILVISDPAVAKSQIALWIEKRTPNTKFIEGTKLTGAGMTMSRIGKQIRIGALPQTHMGTLFLDELDKTPISQAVSLYSSMANHEFTITKASISIQHCPSKQSGVFYCNPKGEKFISDNPEIIKSQLPFHSMAFLTRFHISLCLFQYKLEMFEKVTRHQYKASLGRVKESIIDKDLEVWKDYVRFARLYEIRWVHSKRIEDIIAIFSREVYKQQDHLALPVSPRLNEGVIAIAEAYARMELNDYVGVRHVVKALNTLLICLEKIGLDKRIVLGELKSYVKNVGKHESPSIEEMMNQKA